MGSSLAREDRLSRLSLFLAFAKRRGELKLSLTSRKHEEALRPVLKKYNIRIIDQFLSISATASIVTYAIFTLSDYALKRFGTHNLIYTTFFVVFGIFRYFYLIYFSDVDGNPTEMLLNDKFSVINIILWVICSFFIVYR